MADLNKTYVLTIIHTEGSPNEITFYIPQGPKGETGDKGPTGETGAQGIAGKCAYSCDQIVQGTKTGQSVLKSGIHIPSGKSLHVGDLIVGTNGGVGVITDLGLVTDSGAFYNGCGSIIGATGDKGAKGTTGDKGPTGDQGNKGATGETGNKGATGKTVTLVTVTAVS